MRATVSLLGLYQWDHSILDGLLLPDNFENEDLSLLKDNLLMETSELEVLYTNPAFMKAAITTWCTKNIGTWKWLKDTQMYDYNPIWNADYKISDRTNETSGNVGTTSKTDNFTRNLKEVEETTDKITYNSELEHGYNSTLERGYDSSTGISYSGDEGEEHAGDTVTETKDHIINRTGSETNEHQVAAYNESSTYKPESKDIHSLSDLKDTENGKVIFDDNIKITRDTSWSETDAHTGADTDTHTGADTDAHTGNDTREIDRELDQTGTTSNIETGRSTSDTESENKYERWLRGNYGVKTTQAMIKEEQELAKFNVFDYIIEDFKKRFCLLVY